MRQFLRSEKILMKSSFLKLRFPLLFLLFALMLSFIFSGYTVDAAPFWLKEGAYAYYELETRHITLRNTTLIFNANGTYGWKCLGVVGYAATLEVTINVSGSIFMGVDEQGTYTWGEWWVEEKYDVNINVETREAYIDDEPIGILPYWMPTDAEMLESIANFTSYDNYTLSAVVYGVTPSVETPYKTFEGDELWHVATDTIPQEGASIGNFLFYEKESGLLISGLFVDNIWFQKTMAKAIIGSEGKTEPFNLKETNVWFTPESPSLFELLLPYIITGVVAVAVVGMALVYATKIRKKTPKH